MALSATQQVTARRAVVSDVLLPLAAVNVTKAQVDDTLAALVAWVESAAVQTSFNTAIAGTALAGASAAVKAQCLTIALRARYGDLSGG